MARNFWTVLFVSLSLVLPVAAQKVTGTIHGVVTDSAGAVIRDVDVVVIDKATGQTRTAKTNNSGVCSHRSGARHLPGEHQSSQLQRVCQPGTCAHSPRLTGGDAKATGIAHPVPDSAAFPHKFLMIDHEAVVPAHHLPPRLS